MKRNRLSLAVLLALSMLLVDCSTDVVDGPYIGDSQLMGVECSDQTSGSECFVLSVDVKGTSGEAAAECRVVALAEDGETELMEGARFEEFTIRAGTSFTFDVILPTIDDPRFMRWQAICEPGAPG